MALGLLGCASAAEDPEQLGNWFNDPFFQVRNGMPDCPEPIGPRMSRKDATQQEHSRVERGTSCYLAGTCSKPNSYLYDPPIAAAVQQLFDSDRELGLNSSLWITVTRRLIYLEGCSKDSIAIGKLEAALRNITDVQIVLVNVTPDAHGHLPYQAWPGSSK